MMAKHAWQMMCEDKIFKGADTSELTVLFLLWEAERSQALEMRQGRI